MTNIRLASTCNQRDPSNKRLFKSSEIRSIPATKRFSLTFNPANLSKIRSQFWPSLIHPHVAIVSSNASVFKKWVILVTKQKKKHFQLLRGWVYILPIILFSLLYNIPKFAEVRPCQVIIFKVDTKTDKYKYITIKITNNVPKFPGFCHVQW